MRMCRVTVHLNLFKLFICFFFPSFCALCLYHIKTVPAGRGCVVALFFISFALYIVAFGLDMVVFALFLILFALFLILFALYMVAFALGKVAFG